MLIEMYVMLCLDLAEMDKACVKEYVGEYPSDQVRTKECVENLTKFLQPSKSPWKVDEFTCIPQPDWRIYS